MSGRTVKVHVDRRERISAHDLFNTLDVGYPGERIEVFVNDEPVEPGRWLKQGDELRINML